MEEQQGLRGNLPERKLRQLACGSLERSLLGSVPTTSFASLHIHRCAAFASAAKSKGAPRVWVRRRVAAEAS